MLHENQSMPEFVSEPIIPEPGSFNAAVMASGLASLPAAFVWRGRRYQIVDCLDHVKLTSTEGGRAGGERYLRRQRFTVRLDTGQLAVLDVHRQRPSSTRRTASSVRWFLYTIDDSPTDRGPPPV